MKRLMSFVAAMSVLAVGCGAGAAGTSAPTVEQIATAEAVTSTPTPAETPTQAPTIVSVTWDGTSCEYRGPAAFPRGAPVLWAFSTIGPAAEGDGPAGVLLLVGPVKAGTTWDDVREAEKIPASQWPPPFSDLTRQYEHISSGESWSMHMGGDQYYVGCGTPPASGDRYTTADLVYVIDR